MSGKMQVEASSFVAAPIVGHRILGTVWLNRRRGNTIDYASINDVGGWGKQFQIVWNDCLM